MQACPDEYPSVDTLEALLSCSLDVSDWSDESHTRRDAARGTAGAHSTQHARAGPASAAVATEHRSQLSYDDFVSRYMACNVPVLIRVRPPSGRPTRRSMATARPPARPPWHAAHGPAPQGAAQAWPAAADWVAPCGGVDIDAVCARAPHARVRVTDAARCGPQAPAARHLRRLPIAARSAVATAVARSGGPYLAVDGRTCMAVGLASTMRRPRTPCSECVCPACAAHKAWPATHPPP